MSRVGILLLYSGSIFLFPLLFLHDIVVSLVLIRQLGLHVSGPRCSFAYSIAQGVLALVPDGGQILTLAKAFPTRSILSSIGQPRSVLGELVSS